MLTTPASVLEARAAALAAALPPSAHAAVVRTRAAVGGGAFPGVELPSHGVALAPAGISAQALAGRLRGGAVPVIGVVQRGRVVLDVRALLPGDDAAAAAAVSRALAP
jgi:L-seryl-tRNA(Ser) seleniumtransferase